MEILKEFLSKLWDKSIKDERVKRQLVEDFNTKENYINKKIEEYEKCCIIEDSKNLNEQDIAIINGDNYAEPGSIYRSTVNIENNNFIDSALNIVENLNDPYKDYEISFLHNSDKICIKSYDRELNIPLSVFSSFVEKLINRRENNICIKW